MMKFGVWRKMLPNMIFLVIFSTFLSLHPKIQTYFHRFCSPNRGFRIAMQNLGGKCVYSSEFDAKPKSHISQNYGEMPFGDITKESTKSYIPDGFDVLCAGFLVMLYRKRMGFNETRGTCFLDVAEILRRKRPVIFFWKM